jgi:hypothetical protein
MPLRQPQTSRLPSAALCVAASLLPAMMLRLVMLWLNPWLLLKLPRKLLGTRRLKKPSPAAAAPRPASLPRLMPTPSKGPLRLLPGVAVLPPQLPSRQLLLRLPRRLLPKRPLPRPRLHRQHLLIPLVKRLRLPRLIPR